MVRVIGGGDDDVLSRQQLEALAHLTQLGVFRFKDGLRAGQHLRAQVDALAVFILQHIQRTKKKQKNIRFNMVYSDWLQSSRCVSV